MSVCLLNDSFPPLIDGVANAVVNYAAELERGGRSAVVVTPVVRGAADAVYPFPVLRYPSLDTRRRVGYVTGCPFSPATLRRLKRENVELLHSHCPIVSTALARQLREVLKVPLILTYHTKYDIDIRNALHGKYLQDHAIQALLQNISACDEVWTVSRGAEANLRSLGYGGSCVLMPNGVDVPRGRLPEDEVRRRTGELPDVPVYLYVGRLMWYKGFRLLLEALSRLRRDFCFVIIGDGTDRPAIEAAAEGLGIGKQCRFLGAISDRRLLRAWYCRADLFLFPSTFDTNGLVVREAAAASLPALLIRGSCAAEGITDGRNGFLIDESPEAMAGCLTRIDKKLLRSVGAHAAQELYLSWSDAVRLAEARYAAVLEYHRSGSCGREQTLMDGFFRCQSGLMNALSRLCRS